MKKVKFKNTVLLGAALTTFIPLLLSYIIFITSKLSDNDEMVREALKITGFSISQSELVQEKLFEKENDYTIQEYTKEFISNISDVDIIVVADMTGEKYSHLDEKQIGEIYVGTDKKEVLELGISYYSLMEGSVGTTLRWFEPIMYNGEQIGFVMVGKYKKDINVYNSNTSIRYTSLFILSLSLAIIVSYFLTNKMRKAILNMEPEEIARLYSEKNILINSVKDGIVALNQHGEVIEINNSCYMLFKEFNVTKVIDKLQKYIEEKRNIEMKEFIIDNKKIIVTINHINEGGKYLGVIITLTDKGSINKIAKEITGVDEVIKDLRANIHEFKNSLYVILGLLQLEEYDEAKKYILKAQNIQENTSNKYNNIDDNYIVAVLLGRELIAKERQINFTVTEESFLWENHGIINSYDMVTIIGNLIENAFEACAMSNSQEKKVEVSLYEDDDIIEIQVRDNGVPIDENVKELIYTEGVSSKGKDRGMGLYIVKGRVDLYNGSIEIEQFTDEKIFVVSIYK